MCATGIVMTDLELRVLERYALNATANLIFRVSTYVVPLVENRFPGILDDATS